MDNELICLVCSDVEADRLVGYAYCGCAQVEAYLALRDAKRRKRR